MMNYKKGKNVEEELSRERIPINNLPQNFLWMQVKGGTKVNNVVEFAKKAIDSNEYRTVVWSGSGGGVTKTISCAEIIKRTYPSSHQITKICYRMVEEYWEPEMEGLDTIVAKRQIPCIHILITLDDLDSSVKGYQSSSTKTSFWVQKAITSKPNVQFGPKNKKRNQPGGNRGTNSKESQKKPKEKDVVG